MTSWKLTTCFDKQKHLFFESIKTDYIIETYICSCGNTDFIIKNPQQELNHICTKCENKKFYDANKAWRNFVYFLYQNAELKLSYEYNIQSDDNVVSAFYVTSIPTDIDFSRCKVIYSKKPVYSLILTTNGEIKENHLFQFNKKISDQLKNNLTQYINQNNCFNIPKSGKKDLTLHMARFFLKNKHLKDFDFYYWTNIHKLQKKRNAYQ